MTAAGQVRRFRFSLRGLFGLTVLASLALFAAAEHWRRIDLERRFTGLVEQIHRQQRESEFRQRMLNHELARQKQLLNRYKRRQAISQWHAQGEAGSHSRRPQS
jgi:hypothetical protein